MDMTHPDILHVERTGYPPHTPEPKILGRCQRCKAEVYEDQAYATSQDGIFCDIECCHSFYDIEQYN